MDTSIACSSWSKAAYEGDSNSIKMLNKFCHSVIIYNKDTFLTNNLNSKKDSIEAAKKKFTVYSSVEEMPHFPDGEEAMLNFLSRNMVYPKEARQKGIQGRVYVTYIVDYTGTLRDIKILRGIGGGCDEEALRVIQLMPQWIPGKKDGVPVNVQFNLPLNFTLR